MAGEFEFPSKHATYKERPVGWLKWKTVFWADREKRSPMR